VIFLHQPDLIIGMDALCSFARSDIIINGLEKQILVIEDKEKELWEN